jgi:hypothetical protein
MDRKWAKFCGSCAGSCVEYADNGDGTFTVRNSDQPGGAQITYTEHELDEFAAGWLKRKEG